MSKKPTKKTERLVAINRVLKKNYNPGKLAVEYYRDPYRVLVACVLSQRTRDENTDVAARALFALADTPQRMLNLTPAAIRKAVRPAGFYREKAKNIQDLSRSLVEWFDGRVPDTLEELLTLRGVGRKTANIVLVIGYGIPAIAVDIHVHRIANRLGLIETKTPEQSEFALMEILPKRYWLDFNGLLVSHGREVCKPIRPLCDICPIEQYCRKIITPNAPRKKT